MTTTNSAGVDISYLAMRVFEEDCIASGNRPNDHYNRDAAEQWMAEALRASGIVELIEAASAGKDVATAGHGQAMYFNATDGSADRLRKALAALAGNGKEG